jgi:hypothetical protein
MSNIEHRVILNEQLVKIQEADTLHHHETWFSTHSPIRSIFSVVLLLANATIMGSNYGLCTLPMFPMRKY